MTDMNKQPWPVVSIAEAHALMTQTDTAFEMETREVHGVRMRVWKNAPVTMREVFLAGRVHGAKTFVVYEDERASFESFSRASVALAHTFLDGGVQKGDRIAIAMRNVPEWPVAFFAALLVGAIATPLNAWWTAPELEYGLQDSGAKIAVVDAERFERIQGALPNLRALERVYVSRAIALPAVGRVSSLAAVIGATNDWALLTDQPLPAVPIDSDDDATIFYTSGTTGKPKGALGTHRNGVSTVVASGFSAQRNFLRRGDPIPKPEDRLTQRASLLSVPFFHTTGCQAILCPSLAAGSKIVAMHHWDTEQAMALIERERCTQVGGVPTIAWQILEHPARAKYDLSCIEVMSYGGAPAAPELVTRIKQEFPATLPGNGWGMTETSATFTHIGAEDYQTHPESCGIAMPVCDLRIVGDKGEDLPLGAIGEIWGKGPNVVKGYWQKPKDTAETFVDGWVKTGDLGRLDDEGFLYIVDRKKDMLIRGGENIYCIEVEDALCAHPAIMDAGVIGRAHKILGEEPVAVVTVKPDQTTSEAALRAFVGERLAAFKVPVVIVLLNETLPRNANGKILKKELRQYFDQAVAAA